MDPDAFFLLVGGLVSALFGFGLGAWTLASNLNRRLRKVEGRLRILERTFLLPWERDGKSQFPGAD